ncbi:MAG: iron-containing alcohol dehydrogenase [Terriglobia bacterium]|jgi:glycerol dehydrogenase-like iron-containing ADH family enzyme
MSIANNVRIEYGEGAAENLARDFDSYLVVTMDVPWTITRGVLGKPPQHVHLVESVDFDTVDELANSAPPVEAVFGIGGGQAVDVAKYVAWKRGIKLVLIPTIISTNAFATLTAGLRKKGKVEYLGEARADRLVIDYRLIKTAPKGLNVSGVGDILSCHTGCFDWKLACEHGKEPLGYDEKAERRSLALVERIDANFEAIRDVTNEGIRTLVECELEIVDICIGPGGPGHFRSEEGSEHFFFYNVEHRTGRGFVHGWIVGLGIFLMSRLQGNRATWITGLMDRLGLPYQPRDLKLNSEDVAGALLTLRGRTREDQRWWSVIDEREIGREFVASALAELQF